MSVAKGTDVIRMSWPAEVEMTGWALFFGGGGEAGSRRMSGGFGVTYPGPPHALLSLHPINIYITLQTSSRLDLLPVIFAVYRGPGRLHHTPNASVITL